MPALRVLTPVLSQVAGAAILGGILLSAVLPAGPVNARTAASPASPQNTLPGTIAGPVQVIDGDTLDYRGMSLRLFGVDAPESGQLCVTQNREVSHCGQRAFDNLRARINDAPVQCRILGTEDRGRLLADCTLGGDSINAWLVLSGNAIVSRYRSRNPSQSGLGALVTPNPDFLAQEASARSRKLGLWAEGFTIPQDWRHGESALTGAEIGGLSLAGLLPSLTCKIKGNVSQDGNRIYHVPGGAYYDRTGIDLGNGEHWFCTEAEAQKAGWRRSPK